MKKRRWFISLVLLILGLRLELPALAQPLGIQPQGFSVTIMNICGSAPAPETIEILSVTLTVNGAPVATQVSRRSLKTGETTTFQFPVSQFPVLATVTPNDLTVSWRRGEQSFTTLFFPIQPGQPRDQLCLRVLLTSGLEGETGMIFNQTRSLISGTASRLGVSVDPDHAKLFQIGNAPIAMAPATGAGPTIGVMETGLPMTIGSSLLPPGSYKVDVDFPTRKISFINPLGMVVAQTDAKIEPVAGPSAATSEPLTLTTTSTCQATTSSEGPVKTLVFAGCVGPTISFSLTFIPVPPFVLLLTCIGFLCHPFHPLPPYVSISFCF